MEIKVNGKNITTSPVPKNTAEMRWIGPFSSSTLPAEENESAPEHDYAGGEAPAVGGYRPTVQEDGTVTGPTGIPPPSSSPSSRTGCWFGTSAPRLTDLPDGRS